MEAEVRVATSPPPGSSPVANNNNDNDNDNNNDNDNDNNNKDASPRPPGEKDEEPDDLDAAEEVQSQTTITAAATAATAATAEVAADNGVENGAAEAPPEANDLAPLPPVQVCVRLRPLLHWERTEGHDSSTLQLHDGASGNVCLRPPAGREEAGGSSSSASRTRRFRFNAVMGPERSQQDTWDLARIDELVGKVAAGFHATVFAYGQTGTGKTHTMEGISYEHHNGAAAPSAGAARPKAKIKHGLVPPEQLGLVPRAVGTLFGRVEGFRARAEARVPGSGAASCTVKVSFLQIYNEKIYDLLNPQLSAAQREAGGRGEEFAGLRLRLDAGKRQFFVENLFEFECQTAEEALQHYYAGVANKHVASTAMNVASSRSHTLLVLTLVKRSGLELVAEDPASSPTAAADAPPCREVISKLALVDLAGSERTAANSGFEKSAARFQEAVNVNQSLFVLRKVITALSKRSDSKQGSGEHVPYRESKLTSLLQHALGGNSYLLMLACLSPSDRHYEENLSTLQYASQAASIKNEPSVNVDPKDRLIQQLEARLTTAHSYLLQLVGASELPADLLEAEEAAAAAAAGARGSKGGSSLGRSSGVSGARGLRSARGGRPSGAQQRGPGTAGSAQGQAATTGGFSSGGPYSGGTPAKRSAPGAKDFDELASPPSSVPAGARLTLSAQSPRRPEADLSMTARSEGRNLFAAADAIMSEYYEAPATRRGKSASFAAGAALQASPRGQCTGAQSSRGRAPRPPSLPPASDALTPRVGLPPVAGPSGGFSGSPKRPPLGSMPSPLHKLGDDRGRGSPADFESARSTSAETPTASQDGVRSTGSLATGAAAESGLWDAVEELKEAKAELQKKLRDAESRAEELQAKNLALKKQQAYLEAHLEDSVSTLQERQDECEALRKEKRCSGQEEEAEAALQRENEALQRQLADALQKATVQSCQRENEALQQQLADALQEKQQQQRQQQQQQQEEERRALQKEQQRSAHLQEEPLLQENEALKKERASLQERLEVFYRAMELEASTGTAAADGEGSPDVLRAETANSEVPLAVPGLGGKIERLHSQLVLESVSLQNEVARLKKKKWVLKAVLDSGGENQRRAIDEEVAQLRMSRGGDGKL